IVPVHREHFGRFLSDHVSWRRDQAGIRHQARNVASAPLHNFPPARWSVDVNREITAKHDVQAGGWSLPGRQDLSSGQRAGPAVIRHPFDLTLWSNAKSPVL